MSDKLNEAIQDIAVKHGVVLGKDDPILILQTMNEKLLEENRKTQQEMLAQFREEMENISSQWKDDAKEKAEKVLNAALTSSKEIMTKLIHECSKESIDTIKKEISDSLIEAGKMEARYQKLNRFSLLSSTTMLTISCVIMSLFIAYLVQ